MQKITVVVLIAIIITFTGTGHNAIAGEIPSPLQQIQDGVPVNKVICGDGLVLMQAPSNKPICVFITSVETLEQRGFVSINVVTAVAPISLTPNYQSTTSLITANSSNPSVESAEIPEFLTKIPEDKRHSEPLSSLTPLTEHVTRSELVLADVSALDSNQVNITIFEETLTLSKDRTETSDFVDYAWYGTGDKVSAILLVNGTSVYGLIEISSTTTYSIEFTEIEHVHWLYEKKVPWLPD